MAAHQWRCATPAAFVFGFAILLGAGTATAEDAAWSITQIRGDVQVLRTGFQPTALREGVALRPGDRIITKSNSRAVLSSGKDTIIVAPHSEISLPAPKRPGWGTRIIQEIGTIFLKVESSAERNFEVETPVLAAVVKGTQFSVTANPVGTVVDVRKGAVQVTALESKETAMVLAGQRARLDSRPGSRIVIESNKATSGDKLESIQESKAHGVEQESSSASRSSKEKKKEKEKETESAGSEGRRVALFVSISLLAALAIPVAVSQAGSHIARVRKAKRQAKPVDRARKTDNDAGDDKGPTS